EEMGQGSKGEEFMTGILDSAFAGSSLPLLYVGVVLGAPLVEEVFFRGFAFEGLMRSPLGFWGANVVTSFGWTLLHIQYGLSELTMLFFGGLLFGYARVRTGSLVTPVFMHVAWNLTAMIAAQIFHGQS
ncbi:MAG: CPBP family intramembrane metalloprotease, partial [Verrucomicrobiales bacterium]|nr:CPBP family intramembrane metalloprotease [Verrucomicrobiales bacterium]